MFSVFKGGVLRAPRFAVAPSWPFTINHDHPLANGLVGCWPMGLGTSSTGYEIDISGNSRTAGTISGSPPLAIQAELGLGRSFSTGETQCIRHTTNCGITDVPVTIAAWFMKTTNATAHIGALSYANASGNYFGLITSSTAIIARQYDGTTTASATCGATYSTNIVYHGVAVFESSSSRKIYQDGRNEVENTTALGAMSNLGQVAWGENAGGLYLGGFIGHIRFGCIWNRALSPVEVWQLYDPATRWDMYYPLRTRIFSFGEAEAAPAVTPKRLTLLGVG